MKKVSLLLCSILFLAGSLVLAQAQKPYSMILKGGHVIDPKNNINEVMDVAITAGRAAQAARPAVPARPAGKGQTARPAQPAREAVAAVEGKIALIAKNIDPALGANVVDVSGMYVTPGMIDLHSHVFPGAGRGDLDPDVVTFRAGVTTTVDAGSSGWKSFPQFKKEVVDGSDTRVLAFLNIGAQGYWRDENGRNFESDTSQYNIKEAAETALKHNNIIVGIKAAHFGGPLYLMPVERGIEAGRLAGGIPFMLDGRLDEEVMKRFRPGDIFTHMYGRVLVDTNTNKVQQFVVDARKKGVIFDVGFGAASFDFRQALPAFNAGFLPDTLGTDLNYHSYNGMKNILNVMSTVLSMGMALPDVIRASTWAPAQAIKRPELGHLSVGGVADITVLSIRHGNFGFWDKEDYKIMGDKKLECELTIRNGIVVYDSNGISIPPPAGPDKS